MGETVRKPQFVEDLMGKGLTREQARIVFDQIFDFIAMNLAEGNDVQITGFGKFTTAKRASRVRNVFGAEHVIPERQVAKFKAGRTLRDLINE